jgi:ATP-dependent Clp protease ATP-binding subunit ClpC
MNTVEDTNFTPKAKRVLDVAKQIGQQNNIAEITPDFLFLALLKADSMIVMSAFKSMEVSVDELQKALEKKLPKKTSKKRGLQSDFSPESLKVINESPKISKNFGQNYTGVEHLFFSAISHSALVKSFLREFEIDVSFLASKIQTECKNLSNPTKKPNQKISSNNQESEFNAIKAFCIDYNLKAANGDFDLIQFRDQEVKQISEVLCRKQKRNAILVGESGVGKSAVVGLLAKSIITGECTEFLMGKTIMQLDLTALLAGTKLRGEFEERLHKLIKEIKQAENVIVFIDEIHTVIGLGNDEGSLDSANILKPYLSNENISCIGATTQKEYDKYFQKDTAMTRRFEMVYIKEPSEQDTLKILKGVKGYYENFHGITYPDSLLEDIVKICSKYITNRRFPDKAIDILDQVGAKVKIKSYARPEEFKIRERILAELNKLDSDDTKDQYLKPLLKEYNDMYQIWYDEVTNKKHSAKKKDLYDVVSDKLGSIIDVNTDKSSDLKNIFNNLKKHVFGQDEAIKKISDCVLRSSFGLSSGNRPLGNFMFIGPTGSGKTHLAKTLAKQAFGSEASLVRLDMSEYMEAHSVSKLIGSPPGYIGYGESNVLAKQLDKSPSSVFLFDEIEKAHPDVINILLQVMDNGELTDSNGKKLNFKNCIIILTGNVGFQFSDNKRMGFGAVVNQKPSKETVFDNLKKFFRPEFLARLNDIIVFDELGQDALVNIINFELNQIKNSLKEKGIDINFAPETVSFILNKTNDSNTGARKIIFYIENEIKTKIVDILAINNYNHIKVSVVENDLKLDGKTKKSFASCKA